MDKIEGASSEGDNLDILFEKDRQEAFVRRKRSGCFVHTLQLVVVFETAPAVNSALAIYCEESEQVM